MTQRYWVAVPAQQLLPGDVVDLAGAACLILAARNQNGSTVEVIARHPQGSTKLLRVSYDHLFNKEVQA